MDRQKARRVLQSLGYHDEWHQAAGTGNVFCLTSAEDAGFVRWNPTFLEQKYRPSVAWPDLKQALELYIEGGEPSELVIDLFADRLIDTSGSSARIL